MSMSTKTRSIRNRRPPRDPSAALRPKNALEQQAMMNYTQFRHKVQSANPTTICNATSEKVGRMSLRQLLSGNGDAYCVPIFQRRYCWTEAQWQTLLDDATAQHQQPHQQPHSLGRLTCTRVNKNTTTTTITTQQQGRMGVEGRSCILDGQQRFTTVTILLAAIRDLLHNNNSNNETVFSSSTALIDDLLFSNPIQLRAWLHDPNPSLQDGMELPFARLVPTFCDRRSYYAAILPPTTNTCHRLQPPSCPTTTTNRDRPLRAKQFYLDQLQQKSPESLLSLLHNVLDRLTMLYFPIDTHQNHQDGTDNLMVIYERLALRDATWCKPRRGHEYQSMDGADMIRNLLLGSFASDDDSLSYYQTYWLPLEQQVASSSSSTTTVQDIIQAFLKVQCHQQEGTDAAPLAAANQTTGIIGGQIYADFQLWFSQQLTRDEPSHSSSSSSDATTMEGKVRHVGQQLLDFARRTLQDENTN